MTDLIVSICLLLFFLGGFKDGLAKTLFGPLALAIGAMACMIYYQKTRNLVMALAISVAGPIIIKIIFNLLLKGWNTFKKSEMLSLTSRISGGALSLLWSGAILGATLILIAIIPTQFGWLLKIQNNIADSNTYTVLNNLTGRRIHSHASDLNNTVQFFHKNGDTHLDPN